MIRINKYEILFFIAMFFFLSFNNVGATNMNIKLTLNNTQNNVYIPGVGEVSNMSGNNVYTSPYHYYLASYLNSVLYGLVFHGSNPISIVVEGNSQNHSLIINQNITNSEVFLVFTKGDWHAINNRIDMIETGKFMSYFLPSFSFGLGPKITFKLLLLYNEYKIRSNLVLQKGNYKILAEYTGNFENRPVINITKS